MTLSAETKTQLLGAYYTYCALSVLAFATTGLGAITACPDKENTADLPSMHTIMNTTSSSPAPHHNTQCHQWQLATLITAANLMLPILRLMYVSCGLQQCFHMMWSRIEHGSHTTADEEMGFANTR